MSFSQHLESIYAVMNTKQRFILYKINDCRISGLIMNLIFNSLNEKQEH